METSLDAVQGGGGDGVDASCLAFLVRRAVEDKKKEEEKAKVKKAEGGYGGGGARGEDAGAQQEVPS